MGKRELEKVRKICLGFPEVNERLSHGSPSFFIRDKRTICSYHDAGHHDPRSTIWVPAPPGAQEELVSTEPERFFRPPYVGPSGWIGMWLDGTGDLAPDWDEVTALIEEAYRKVGPKTLVKLLDPPE